MKEENIEKLAPYEQKLKYIVYQSFMSLSNGEFGTLMAIYNDEYGTPLTQSQRNCSTCRLRALTRLGKDYFESRDALAKAKREAAKNDTPKEEPKKKKGRPSKIKEIEKSIEEEDK